MSMETQDSAASQSADRKVTTHPANAAEGHNQTPLLRATNVLAAYSGQDGKPVIAVDDVSLEIAEGEIMGLAGESGCGKTTLGSALSLTARPPLYVHGGTMEIDGKVIDLATTRGDSGKMRSWRGSVVSMLPQGAMNSVSPTMKIKDLVVDVYRAHHPRARKEEALDRARDRLKSLDLPVRVLDSYPHQLSGGMKQRVVTIISTLLNPRLLIADEPTSALDVSSQKALLEMLKEMLHQRIMSGVIFVTHDLPVLSDVSTKLSIMYGGQIVDTGPTLELIHQPTHPYTKALMAAVLDPTRETREKRVMGIPGSPPNLMKPPSGCRFHPRCPLVMPECSGEQPQLLPVAPNHLTACYWAEKNPGKTVPDKEVLAS